MKAKLIHEEFKENTDPIDDMHIGVNWKVKELRKKLSDLWDEYYSRMLNDEDVGLALDILEKIDDIIHEIFDD